MPKKPASANIATLVLSSDQPARSMARGIAAGAAQDRAIGGAHQARHGRSTAMTSAAMIGNGNEAAASSSSAPASQAGALPPGVGRIRTAMPSQTKDMPSVTTIDGRLRRWISAPSRHRRGCRQPAPAMPRSGVSFSQVAADADDEADIGADRQVEIVDGDDAHLRDGGERDRDRQIEHQVEARHSSSRAAADRRSREAGWRATGTAGCARSSRGESESRDHALSAKEECKHLLLGQLVAGRDRRRWRRCGRHRRGRSASARPSRSCTR